MQFAHFEFDPEKDRLGEGQLSEVYKAEDLNLGRTVALKILRAHAEIDPQAERRFKREAQHTSSLAHEHIATIYEYDEYQGTHFIAMEYLEGETLDKIIKNRSLGYEECLRIARQVTGALEKVHEAGIIHRDLKPGNMLLQPDGTLKLLDFGIARARNETGITQQGMLVGTVLFMSPEQVRGEELDFRSDIFSLGAVLYNIMTGALPFPGESFPEVCMAILDGKLQRPGEVRSGFPEPLEEFLMKCLESAPEGRFSDARDAHGYLLTVVNKLTGTRTLRPSSLRGVIVLDEVAYEGETDSMLGAIARGFRKDLAGALGRNKGLEIVLASTSDLEPDQTQDFLVETSLAIDEDRAVLELTLVQFEVGDDGHEEISRDDHQISTEQDHEWAMQESLVRNTMRVLRKSLTQAPVQPDKHQAKKAEEARQMVIGGLDVLRRGTTKHLLSATTIFRRAQEMHRYCALAQAGMAEALVRKCLTWDGDPTFLDEARESAGRALALDPQCALAHTAMGFAHHISGHYEDAQREYRIAMQLDNSEWLSHRLLGAMHAREGNYKGASPLLQRAIDLNPTHIATYDHLYSVLQRLGRYEQALECADNGIEAARAHVAQTPDDMDAHAHMALLMARRGSSDMARKAVEKSRQFAPKDGTTSFHAACVYALLGDSEDALNCLHAAQDRGFYLKSELTSNTDLDNLRGMPEFQELLS